jgi:hypothetical protein
MNAKIKQWFAGLGKGQKVAVWVAPSILLTVLVVLLLLSFGSQPPAQHTATNINQEMQNLVAQVADLKQQVEVATTVAKEAKAGLQEAVTRAANEAAEVTAEKVRKEQAAEYKKSVDELRSALAARSAQPTSASSAATDLLKATPSGGSSTVDLSIKTGAAAEIHEAAKAAKMLSEKQVGKQGAGKIVPGGVSQSNVQKYTKLDLELAEEKLCQVKDKISWIIGSIRNNESFLAQERTKDMSHCNPEFRIWFRNHIRELERKSADWKEELAKTHLLLPEAEKQVKAIKAALGCT